ncbi:MAG TPA: dethiobiotin synthase [Candidatus Aphodousia faecipullorum]|nr:dethiobiotin synthase [Candidatus Aphodousia faecipullorum]
MATTNDTVFFVSGIDTDVGKSVATGWLAKRWQDEGLSIITQKLVQTGSDRGSPDIALHRRLMGRHFLEDDEGLTAPAVYTYPCSPHLACELDHKTLPLETILQATQTLSDRYERVLVEGAGGIMVPLTRSLLTIDLIAKQKWPLIFVTSGKLGSISQTLLALEAVKTRGIQLHTLIFNDWHNHPDDVIDRDTFGYFAEFLKNQWPEAALLRCPRL